METFWRNIRNFGFWGFESALWNNRKFCFLKHKKFFRDFHLPKYRTSFFWENIRNFLILKLESFISRNIRNFFQGGFFLFFLAWTWNYTTWMISFVWIMYHFIFTFPLGLLNTLYFVQAVFLLGQSRYAYDYFNFSVTLCLQYA